MSNKFLKKIISITAAVAFFILYSAPSFADDYNNISVWINFDSDMVHLDQVQANEYGLEKLNLRIGEKETAEINTMLIAATAYPQVQALINSFKYCEKTYAQNLQAAFTYKVSNKKFSDQTPVEYFHAWRLSAVIACSTYEKLGKKNPSITHRIQVEVVQNKDKSIVFASPSPISIIVRGKQSLNN